MSDSTKEKLNIDELAELFKNLEDEAMKKMLDRAGVTDEDLENLPAEADVPAASPDASDARADEQQAEDARADDAQPAEEARAERGKRALTWKDAPAESGDTVGSDSGEAAAPAEAAATVDEDLQSKAAAAIKAAAPAGEGLEPEHIGHLLRVLGDDLLKDMLESAGLDPEDAAEAAEEAGSKEAAEGEPGSEAPAKAEGAEAAGQDAGGETKGKVEKAAGGEASGEAEGSAKAQEPDAEAAAAANKVKAPRKKRKITLKRRLLFVFIFVGIIGLLAAANKIFMSVSINNNDPIQYAAQSDEISADEGILNVNNVSASVPTDGSVEYSISYSWAEEDEKYPSVPHAISAIYSDTEGRHLYSISLYRNETIAKDKIPSGKKASNWFDSWPSDTESEICQAPLDTENVKGFYIYPHEPDAEGNPVSEYSDFSYYFSVKDGKDISIYVLEGVCLDGESYEALRTVMDECIKTISVK